MFCFSQVTWTLSQGLLNSSQTCWNTIAFREQHSSSALLDPTQLLKQMLIGELVPQHLALLPLENCHWLSQNFEPPKRCNSCLLLSFGETDPWGTVFHKFHNEPFADPGTKLRSTWLPVLPFEHETCSREETPSVCTRGTSQGTVSVGMGGQTTFPSPQVLLPHASSYNLDHTECIEASFYSTFISAVICKVALAEKSQAAEQILF